MKALLPRYGVASTRPGTSAAQLEGANGGRGVGYSSSRVDRHLASDPQAMLTGISSRVASKPLPELPANPSAMPSYSTQLQLPMKGTTPLRLPPNWRSGQKESPLQTLSQIRRIIVQNGGKREVPTSTVSYATEHPGAIHRGAVTRSQLEANFELVALIGFLTESSIDDWDLVVEVCERSSASESAARAATIALGKKFKQGDPSTQFTTAILWSAMLQNTTNTFTSEAASYRFLRQLETVITAESTLTVVRERLLDILASAVYAYGKQPGKEALMATWHRVRPQQKPAEGTPFDADDVALGLASATLSRTLPVPGVSTRREGSPLEMLMKKYLPLDLSGQVAITDPLNPAHGGLADVFSGSLHGSKVAVKVLRVRKSRPPNPNWDASNERRIMREIHVWAALKHRNICELLGYATGFSDYPAMISPWCEHGTATEYFDGQRVSVTERVRLACDVAEGLEYLHQLKIVHGDLKPNNVLIDKTCVARLCDFGLVRVVEGPAGMTTTSPYTGTERYKPPELFISKTNRNPVATFEGDIYSLGCLMLEFVEDISPFQRFRTNHSLWNALLDRHPPALRSECKGVLSGMTESFWSLLELCWGGPASRPGISDIVQILNLSI